MSQIKAGRVSVLGGTNRVIGNGDTDWAEVVTSYSMFGLLPEAGNTAVVVQTKTAPGASASGFWEVTLAANYNGPDVVDSEYIIHKDFSPNKNFPMFTFGDHYMTQILNRFILIMDIAPTGGGPGGVSGLPELVNLLALDTMTTMDKAKPSSYFLTENGVGQVWRLLSGAPTPGTSDRPTIDDVTAHFTRTL